ncbi:MAG TPA: DNA polymerase III subunit gamma and tau, partial [Microterricola sp.]
AEREAMHARVATVAPPREGDVLPARETASSAAPDDDGDDADEYPDTDAAAGDLAPPTAAPSLAPAVTTRNDGVQRYGEAVVRQVLGATFVREEPHQQPTRFN